MEDRGEVKKQVAKQAAVDTEFFMENVATIRVQKKGSCEQEQVS